MNYEELEQLLQFDEKESSLFMPNEIFDDLKNKITNTPHIAFAYSYTYLSTWLYRYTKYLHQNGLIDNNIMKEILGYNPDTRTINYLIKKNGLLDQIGYFETVRDYPVSWSYSDLETDGIEFSMSSEFPEFLPMTPKRFTLKYPVKAFERFIAAENLELTGTFYDVSYTHLIPFEIFMYCMSNEEIGCTGFYLYCFIKQKNDLYKEGYDISLVNLAESSGIGDRTLDKYLNALKSYKMIDFRHNQQFFSIALNDEERMANTYIANEYFAFSDKPVPFNKIEIVTKRDYLKMLKEKDSTDYVWGNREKIDIPLNDLPY